MIEEAAGSSPLARGLRPSAILRSRRSRIIPARAGFTADMDAVLPFSQDHPRSRGVYTRTQLAPVAADGSSPLARGLLCVTAGSGAAWGIIPARAGFTGLPARRGLARPDHPRSRGVYSRPTCRPLSPPWIIPARAGFTDDLRDAVRREKDHPRSRGVYRGRCHITEVPVRIIPARAGFTTS